MTSKDQLRYSAGKPKLTYPFSSVKAWKLVRDSFKPGTFPDGESLYDEDVPNTAENLVVHISEFLGRDCDSLVHTFVDTMNLLQEDLQGDPPDYSESFDGFLADTHIALEQLCAVFEYGERKYARGNYRKGAPVTSYLDSALRHLSAYMRGYENDGESGLPHLAHVAWNLLIAMDQPKSRDDRLPAVSDPSESMDCLCADSANGALRSAPAPAMFDWKPMFGSEDAAVCRLNGYVLRVYADLDVEVGTEEQDKLRNEFIKSYASNIEGAKRFAEQRYLAEVGRRAIA